MSDRIVYGDYHLLGRLNTGGMAEVFLGRRVDAPPDADLLAVKRMLPRLSQSSEFSTMFRDEARIANRLNHPNICRVLDEGSHQGQLFLVLEFIHGKDMRVVYTRANERGERIPYAIVSVVLANIADALDHAHNMRNADGTFENLVHRDVSPQNILIGYDGVPKLIDFGVARAKSSVAQTKVGIVKGKFGYMSPEQAMAKPLDGRSDIWALGVVFYQLLTGKLPFQGMGELDTLRKIAAGQSIPITEVAPEIPAPIVEVINRAMKPEPSERFQRARDFAAACRSFARTETQRTDAHLLADYMQRLFEREYRLERDRIRQYRDGKDASSLEQGRQRTTLNLDTLSLAAGYQSKQTAAATVPDAEAAADDVEEKPDFNEPTVRDVLSSESQFEQGETVPMVLPTPPRSSWMTDDQASWLAVVLLASASVLAGTYFYAMSVPLPGITE